jgi:hypothetical protein
MLCCAGNTRFSTKLEIRSRLLFRDKKNCRQDRRVLGMDMANAAEDVVWADLGRVGMWMGGEKV